MTVSGGVVRRAAARASLPLLPLPPLLLLPLLLLSDASGGGAFSVPTAVPAAAAAASFVPARVGFSSFSRPEGGSHRRRRPRRSNDAASVDASEAWGARSVDDDAGDESLEASICIVGGGMSGLAAAVTAAESPNKPEGCKIVLLERSSTLGGRVRSDATDNGGYVLDRGFAVFVEEYPQSKRILDYDDLRLGRFLPGGLVKLDDGSKEDGLLGKVVDPLRRPNDLLTAIASPVGKPSDKLRIVPLLWNVRTKSLEELFEEEETDTLSCLRDRYGFSEKMLDEFFAPFLEGVYLCPLEEQSSRMFHFVFKMFSKGSASLPRGGMGAVSKQLVDRAERAGVEIRAGREVTALDSTGGRDGGERSSFSVELARGEANVRAECVIVATEAPAASRILSSLAGPESTLFDDDEAPPSPPQRSVGCLYYSLDADRLPVDEPILILNGMGKARRNTKRCPANNVCFPSVVNEGYAPSGKHLCSVAVLERAMDLYEDDDAGLDRAVREQLATWFPNYADDVREKWILEGIYRIRNAQPGQLGGSHAANVHGGRDPSTFRGERLPRGVFVCGDHVATATLNGAIESGVAAGTAAVDAIVR